MNSRMTFFNNQYAPQQLPSLAKASYFQLYQKNSNFAVVKFILEVCNKLEGKINLRILFSKYLRDFSFKSVDLVT